ncbi:hypothetical protein [Microbispora bryophytorum]|uniref:hypothetical protein n=1 Tax=Microbispora bryophytorum TaxID=1460882 RepID=UPI0034070FD9
MTVVKNILAVIGALTLAGFTVIGMLALLSHRAEQRRLHGTRDQRARRPAEEVAKSPAQWSDFWRDHDLHKLRIFKEKTK